MKKMGMVGLVLMLVFISADLTHSQDQQVLIDIDPGSCSNFINTNSEGYTLVLILGTKDLNVRQIDPLTLVLTGSEGTAFAPVIWNYGDVANPHECEKETPDGYDDLTLKFKTEDILKLLTNAGYGDVVILTLSGYLGEDYPISGYDEVAVVYKEEDILADGKIEAEKSLPRAGILALETMTNGFDADEPSGPYIVPGETVQFLYVVSNIGNLFLRNIIVTDDQRVWVNCPKRWLLKGETMTCAGYGMSIAGQYSTVGRVTAITPLLEDVSDEDPTHYYGGPLDIEKFTNGTQADEPPGPTLQTEGVVEWKYIVTNRSSDIPITDIVIVDDQGVIVSCPQSELMPREQMICTGEGIVVEGQYRNIAYATGLTPDGVEVIDQDPSHYFGESLEPECPDCCYDACTYYDGEIDEECLSDCCSNPDEFCEQ